MLRAICWLAFNDGRPGVIGNNTNYKSGPGNEGRGEKRKGRKGKEMCSDTGRFS